MRKIRNIKRNKILMRERIKKKYFDLLSCSTQALFIIELNKNSILSGIGSKFTRFILTKIDFIFRENNNFFN